MIYFLGVGLVIIIGKVYFTYNFLDGRRLIRDMLDRVRLSRGSLWAWDNYWRQNPNEADIIVCLTTIPSRLPYIEQTLKSLLYQSRRPQRIRLHLPAFSHREQRPYIIPDWLKTLQSIEIVHCEDYGPVTKLIPALQSLEPDQKILIVDDDMIYPPTLIEHFFRCSNKYPHIAVGSSGWIVPTDLTHRPITLWDNIRQLPPVSTRATRLKKGRQIDILEGYSGYLVKPKFFRFEEIIDYSNAPEAAFFVDDVWISAHCTAPKYVFPAKRFCFYRWQHHSFFKDTSLSLINDGDPENRNNTIMIRHFKDRWLLQIGCYDLSY